jgi:hypothetical protein
VIRYPVNETKLRAAILRLDANWFTDAANELSGLPASPKTSDFKPLWRKIKQIYIDLQYSKCCFCEKPLEGKIEQDVEHFRPKAEVKPWKVPPRLAAEGVVVQQRADGSSEDGYSQLAYEPFNYAMACKTCNSTLKRNLFPIEGRRDAIGTRPAAMRGEQALFIYPIGSIDVDPERLIEFDALSPLPKEQRGFGRRRALVTIDVFRLDDSSNRRTLFKQRAYFLRLLFLELEGEAHATTDAKAQSHRTVIANLTSPQAPFTNCMISFKRLHGSDPKRAGLIADECTKLMNRRSVRRRGR